MTPLEQLLAAARAVTASHTRQALTAGRDPGPDTEWHEVVSASALDDLRAALDTVPSDALLVTLGLGHRLIRADEGLLNHWGTRTLDGRRLGMTWGEPDAEGVYTPTITATDDGAVVVTPQWPWPGNTRLPWQVWNEVPHPDGMTIYDPDGFRGGKPIIVTWDEFEAARGECTMVAGRNGREQPAAVGRDGTE